MKSCDDSHILAWKIWSERRGEAPAGEETKKSRFRPNEISTDRLSRGDPWQLATLDSEDRSGVCPA